MWNLFCRNECAVKGNLIISDKKQLPRPTQLLTLQGQREGREEERILAQANGSEQILGVCQALYF